MPYPTFEARSAAPHSKLTDYDDSGYGDVANHKFIHASDYPVLYWLLQSLADFGGNVGMAYYSFRKYLHLPQEFCWIVYDLPQIIEAEKMVRESRRTRTIIVEG